MERIFLRWHNLKKKKKINNVKKALNKDTMLCCVVKADAYGHGAVEVSV